MPIRGFAGYGGAAASLVNNAGGFTAVLGDAGKSGSSYFFRPAVANDSDVVEDEKGSWPDFHIINPSNTTAMQATANMPPGMGAARLNTSSSSNLSTSFGESFNMQNSRLVGGFVMPTTGTGMRMLYFANKKDENYGCFFTDYYEIADDMFIEYEALPE